MKLSDETKVGVFTLAALGLLVFVISFLGIFSFSSSGYNIDVEFKQVKGIKPDNMVKYAGVDVGRVGKIFFEGNKVYVRLNVDDNCKIPIGSSFTIGTDGLLGEKFIDISPPEGSISGYIAQGSKIVGLQPKGLDEFMSSSSDVLVKLEYMADSINQILGDEDVQLSIKQTLINSASITDNLDKTTKTMNEILLANQAQINSMVYHLNNMSKSLNASALRTEKMLEQIDNNGKTSANVVKMVENLAVASQRVENMASKLEGVVTDEKTLSNIKESIANAKEASVKANKILTNVSSIKVTPSADFWYAPKADKQYRADLSVTIDKGKADYLMVGVADLGNKERLNMQMGRYFNNFGLRIGAMQGEAGIGFDYRINDKIKIFTDLYDADEHKVKVGGEYKLSKNVSLMLQSLNVRSNFEDTAYIGIRQYF